MEATALNHADLFTGELVRLKAIDPEAHGKAMSQWARQSDYWRFSTTSPAGLHSGKATQKWLEKLVENPNCYPFTIHTLADDRLVGEIDFDGVDWSNGEAFVGLGLGERSDWGKGYGSDALKVMLRYAFHELNLHRVSLSVFEYNPRAIRSYEKCGFKHEGRIRQSILRDGQRYDVLFMGIRRDEFEIQDTGDHIPNA